ncbi:hypothetical protein HA402_011240 [Bradysia odoriphaga]|nr:hypothetical protein HA402_011240 [Bradysia odoriphaga]
MMNCDASLPFHRYWRGTGSGTDHFYTTDFDEGNRNVIALGGQYEGVMCNIWPVNTTANNCQLALNNLVPLHRLYHSVVRDHFYTTSTREADNAATSLCYVREMSPGLVATNQCDCECGASLQPVIRLYKKTNAASPNRRDDHFYTTNSTEATEAVKSLGYKRVGTAYYCSAVKDKCGAKLALHRYFLLGSDHFYTTSLSEGQKAVTSGEGVYEGIMCFTWAVENLKSENDEYTDKGFTFHNMGPAYVETVTNVFVNTSYINVPMSFRSLNFGYPINGHMTIFNQEFRNSLKYCRHGSIKDVENLSDTFGKLGIEPKVKPDLRYREIVKEIDALPKTDFSDCKLFLCVYMSHGRDNGYVHAADKEFNLRQTIIDPIMGNRSLYGIPKIFIIVACRGEHNYEEDDNEEFDGCITSTGTGIDYSNYIISYSTYEGHVSKRQNSGTYFIQNLCESINESNDTTKIHSIFAKVNSKLVQMGKQVPVFETTMGDISFRDLASPAHYVQYL